MRFLPFLLSLFITVAIAQPISSPIGSPVGSPFGSITGQSTTPDMSDAVAWYRKGQGITVTGSGVSQWDDQSGQDNHLLQATDTNRPALQAGGSILFDGIDNFLKTNAFTLNQPTTVYLLGKQVTWTDNDYILDGNATSSALVFQNSSSPIIKAYAGTFSSSNSDLILDTYGVISVVFNGASSSISINNNTAITGDFGAQNPSGFTLGARGDGAGSWSNIQVQEIIIYNVAHNAEQRAAVIRYLSRVGGIPLTYQFDPNRFNNIAANDAAYRYKKAA